MLKHIGNGTTCRDHIITLQVLPFPSDYKQYINNTHLITYINKTIMEKLMLKIVNAALKEDSIENSLELDRETNTAKWRGLCIYLLITASWISIGSDKDLLGIQDYIYQGEFREWLESNYPIHNYHLYPAHENWEERLIILEKYREHLESLIKEEES